MISGDRDENATMDVCCASEGEGIKCKAEEKNGNRTSN